MSFERDAGEGPTGLACGRVKLGIYLHTVRQPGFMDEGGTKPTVLLFRPNEPTMHSRRLLGWPSALAPKVLGSDE